MALHRDKSPADSEDVHALALLDPLVAFTAINLGLLTGDKAAAVCAVGPTARRRKTGTEHLRDERTHDARSQAARHASQFHREADDVAHQRVTQINSAVKTTPAAIANATRANFMKTVERRRCSSASSSNFSA